MLSMLSTKSFTQAGPAITRRASPVVGPNVARPSVQTLCVSSRSGPVQYDLNVHGRHLDVSPDLDTYVRGRIETILNKLQGADFLEAEGGLRNVDVRLMNRRAEIRLHPAHQNKALHDTFLRHGELKAEQEGSGAKDSFDKALLVLERKLHRWTKASPLKRNYRGPGVAHGAGQGRS